MKGPEPKFNKRKKKKGPKEREAPNRGDRTQLECREENTESANDAEGNQVMNARALKRGGGMGYCIEKNGWHHGHDEGCLSPCGVMMFFPRHRSSFDGGVHKTDGRQLT